MYPILYDEKRHVKPSLWFDSYVSTYIEQDVGGQINKENIALFRKFLRLCASSSGRQFSSYKVSNALGVSVPTIQNWLSILESSYIIFFLEVDSENMGKKLQKTPKLYFYDTGLLCYLLDIESKKDLVLSQYKGSIVETFAISEMIKIRQNKGKKENLTYFRDKYGFEVDIIANWKKKIIFEVKGSSTFKMQDSHSLIKYKELSKEDEEGVLLYLGDMYFESNGIKYIPFSMWDEFFLENS